MAITSDQTTLAVTYAHRTVNQEQSVTRLQATVPSVHRASRETFVIRTVTREPTDRTAPKHAASVNPKTPQVTVAQPRGNVFTDVWLDGRGSFARQDVTTANMGQAVLKVVVSVREQLPVTKRMDTVPSATLDGAFPCAKQNA